jgi:hypothetical protein
VKALFNFIKAQINARVPDPAIKTVRMWNNQLLHSNGNQSREARGYRDEKSFKYPACFIEFIIQEVNSLPLGITDYLLTVRFRFALERYKFERLDTFDFCDAFQKAIQGLSPTVASGLTFTTFQLIRPEFDEDFNNVEAPYVDYRTRFRNTASYDRATDVLHGPITPVVTGEVITFDEL